MTCMRQHTLQPDDKGVFCMLATSTVTTNPVTDIHDPGHASISGIPRMLGGAHNVAVARKSSVGLLLSNG